MILQSIEVISDRELDNLAEGGQQQIELTIALKYTATAREAGIVGKLLVAGKMPSAQFWDAVDYGDAGDWHCQQDGCKLLVKPVGDRRYCGRGHEQS